MAEVICDRIAHQTVSVAEAKVFLMGGMRGLQVLYNRAIAIVEHSEVFVK